MNVLIKPVITEKANDESELRNRYSFVVDRRANKIEIKQAVEKKYGVSVEKVRTMIYGSEEKSKYTRRGVQRGKTGTYKKAVVQVAEGDAIDFYSNI